MSEKPEPMLDTDGKPVMLMGFPVYKTGWELNITDGDMAMLFPGESDWRIVRVECPE